MPPRRLTAVGGYIFAGSFTLGVREAGFDVLAHFEDDDYGVDTFQRNQPGIPVYYPPDAWPLDDLAGKGVDLVYGNPPCAVFSAIGSSAQGKTDFRDDPRLSCWYRLVGAGLALRSTVFMGESVPQFITRGWPAASKLARMCLDAGYSVTFVRHDGKYMGLPQQRRRVMMIAHKVKLAWPTPCDTRTPRQAFEGLVDPGPYHRMYDSWSEIMHRVKPGDNVRDVFYAAYDRSFISEHALRRPDLFTFRVDPENVLSTVIRMSHVHWAEDRFCGVNEYKRLCGYPDWYQWPDDMNIGHVISEMVRAVLPPAAKYFAGVVRRGILSGIPIKESRARMVTMWSKSNRTVNFDMDLGTVDVTEEVMRG